MKKYSVNVLGKNGYSFAVETHGSETDESIVDFCLENDLFDNRDDAFQCVIEELDESEFEFFSDCCYEMS